MNRLDKAKKQLTDLEEAWEGEFDLWSRCSLDIQRVFRGHLGRVALLARIEGNVDNPFVIPNYIGSSRLDFLFVKQNEQS
jgi:hypothetical protein